MSKHVSGAAIDVFPTEPKRQGDPFESQLRAELEKAINDYWGMWRLPSRVCYGDSGAPTFVDGSKSTG